MSYTPEIPLFFTCICLFIEVLAINIVGNMKRYSISKYNVHF